MYFSVKWQQVVFAYREEFNIAYQHHFVGIDFELGFEHFLGAVSKACEQLLAGTPNTVGGVEQAFTVRVFANGFQKQAYCLAHAFLVIADRPGRMGGTGLVVEEGIECFGIAHQLVNPALFFRDSGIGTGGMSESGRLLSLSHTSRFGAFLTLAKISASSFSLSVSLTSS